MVAHAEDLRVEVQGQENGDAIVEAILRDHKEAPLEPADRAMLDYAIKLTLTPADVSSQDVDALRREGFDDAAIHDIAQVTGLLNYYNRLADGLGIDPEP